MVVFRQRCFKQRTLLDDFPEVEVFTKFCLSKELIMLLFGELHPFLEPTTLHSHVIPPITNLLAVLHFLVPLIRW